MREAFIANFTRDLATHLSITQNRIYVTKVTVSQSQRRSLAEGTVTVDFYIFDTGAAGEIPASGLEAKLKEDVGTLSLSGLIVDSAEEIILPSPPPSPPPPSPTPSPPPDSVVNTGLSNNIVIVIVVVAVVVVLVVVCIAGFVCYRRHKRKGDSTIQPAVVERAIVQPPPLSQVTSQPQSP